MEKTADPHDRWEEVDHILPFPITSDAARILYRTAAISEYECHVEYAAVRAWQPTYEQDLAWIDRSLMSDWPISVLMDSRPEQFDSSECADLMDLSIDLLSRVVAPKGSVSQPCLVFRW
jgi:hypothetical protein